LTPKLSDQAYKYLKSLDKTTAKRIVDKIKALAEEPYNIRLSKPLKASNKRSARIGDYRILFVFEKDILLVSDIGPRGKVYRNA
jgi:mRNA interferase RelE/StbE